MITHFNPLQIKNIELRKTIESETFYYEAEYKTWWGKKYEAGIKEAQGIVFNTKSHNDHILTEKEINGYNLLLIDGKVYKKPTVFINFIDDTFLGYYFETNLGAHEFIEKVVEDCLPVKIMKVYN